MNEPDQNRGTILNMTCPECGSLGMKFIKGDGALDDWKDLVAELSTVRYQADAPNDEMEAAVESANEAFADAFAVPDHVPDTAQIVYCPDMTTCGYHTFVESIEWEKIPRRAVE